MFNKEAASEGEARGLDNQDKWKMYWDHKLAGRVFPMNVMFGGFIDVLEPDKEKKESEGEDGEGVLRSLSRKC